MEVIVQKYGGSSLSSPEKITQIAKRILDIEASGKAVTVVVSAMGDTTDHLVAMAEQISPSPPHRELDMLLSTGEQVSIALLSMAIDNLGGSAISLTGLQSGIITDDRHSNAKIKEIRVRRVLNPLQEGKVVIVAGFQGVSGDTEITTLGRGGSDTTAAALAASLNAEICEILTDVDGVFTADPNIVENSVKLDYIAYEEMLELAASGAQVLHPRAVEIAMKYRIPFVVKPALRPGIGTTITEDKMLEKVAITGITVDENVAKIAIKEVPDSPGVASKIFNAISRAKINIRLIIQGVSDGDKSDLTMLADQADMESVVDILRNICLKIKAKGVTYESGMAEISIVGSGIASSSGVAAKMFQTLSKNNINIELISTSHIRVACIVDQKRIKDAVRALHKAFKLEKLKRELL